MMAMFSKKKKINKYIVTKAKLYQRVYNITKATQRNSNWPLIILHTFLRFVQ